MEVTPRKPAGAQGDFQSATKRLTHCKVQELKQGRAVSPTALLNQSVNVRSRAWWSNAYIQHQIHKDSDPMKLEM